MTYWEFAFHLKHTVVCSAVGALPKNQEDSLTWRNEPVKEEQEGSCRAFPLGDRLEE